MFLRVSTFVALAFASCGSLLSAESAKSSSTAVPDVRHSTVSTAKQLLHLAGLIPEDGVFLIASTHWKSQLVSTRVYLQTLRPGRTVDRGTVIGIWRFAKADDDTKTVRVGDYVGLSFEKAESKAVKAGLRVMRSVQTKKKGTVTHHYPRKGQLVFQGTSIFFVGTNDD